MLTKAIESIGKNTNFFIISIGGIFRLLYEIIKNIPNLKYKELIKELYNIGVKSLPIIFMTGIFVGVIMVIQTGFYVREYNIAQVLGWGVGFTGFREVCPLMVGLMFSGRIGAYNSSELGTMKISKQIDALKVLAIDPIEFLILPRFIAILFMISLLTIIADFMTVVSGLFIGKLMVGVSFSTFLSSFFDYVSINDFYLSILKSFFFGIIIALVSSYFGLRTKASSFDLAKMVNKSIVITSTSIFLLDYILTFTVKL